MLHSVACFWFCSLHHITMMMYAMVSRENFFVIMLDKQVGLTGYHFTICLCQKKEVVCLTNGLVYWSARNFGCRRCALMTSLAGLWFHFAAYYLLLKSIISLVINIETVSLSLQYSCICLWLSADSMSLLAYRKNYCCYALRYSQFSHGVQEELFCCHALHTEILVVCIVLVPASGVLEELFCYHAYQFDLLHAAVFCGFSAGDCFVFMFLDLDILQKPVNGYRHDRTGRAQKLFL